jgi:MOSC domain
VVEGAEQGFEEDFWADLLIGENLKFILKSIDVDFATGKPGTNEAGLTLKMLQNDRREDAGRKWSPIFGGMGSWARLKRARGSK